MARMPGALWRPVPHSSNRISRHDVLCMHTMVGSLWGTDTYFQNSGGINSHFGVGHDGTIIQWVDTAFWSGANLDGNWRIISVETADMGAGFPAWNTNDGSQVPAWTGAQVEALAEIARWANAVHGIPLTMVPDSQVGRRGVGFHRQGVDPYRVSGGEKWSNAYGKVCPGSRRIAQIPEVIARASGAEEDDMPYSEAQIISMVQKGVQSALIKQSAGGIGPSDLDSYLNGIADRAASASRLGAQAVALLQRQPGAEVDVQALAAALVPLMAPVLESKLGASKQDVEDALREVLGGLDSAA